jgi:hypothetical protein
MEGEVKEFKVLVESNDEMLLGGKKHKCAISAGTLEEFRRAVEHSLQSIQAFNLPPRGTLKLECWDTEFDEYIGWFDLPLDRCITSDKSLYCFVVAALDKLDQLTPSSRIRISIFRPSGPIISDSSSIASLMLRVSNLHKEGVISEADRGIEYNSSPSTPNAQHSQDQQRILFCGLGI